MPSGFTQVSLLYKKGIVHIASRSVPQLSFVEQKSSVFFFCLSLFDVFRALELHNYHKKNSSNQRAHISLSTIVLRIFVRSQIFLREIYIKAPLNN